MLCGFLKEWEECGCHEVDLRYVGAVDVIPVFKGCLFVFEHLFLHCFGGAGFSFEGLGADSGVVDEDVEMFLFLGNLVVESDDIFLVGDVGRDGDDLTGNTLAIGIGHRLQLLLGAASDVDLEPVSFLFKIGLRYTSPLRH